MILPCVFQALFLFCISHLVFEDGLPLLAVGHSRLWIDMKQERIAFQVGENIRSFQNDKSDQGEQSDQSVQSNQSLQNTKVTNVSKMTGDKSDQSNQSD